MDEEETVKTFGDFTERWWMMYMLLVDLLTTLYEDLMKALRAAYDDITLFWMDETDSSTPLDTR
jgi:hypothetical protein